MTMHSMTPRQRLVGYIFPAIIAVIAVLAAPGFNETGRIWWLVAILALPLLLAIVICVEYRSVALGFDASGVHYRSVGYRLHAPWERVTLENNGGSLVLRVASPTPEFFPWLGFLFKVLAVFAPGRAGRAGGMMSIIPLYAFVGKGNDAVLRDLGAVAPAATMSGAV